MATMRRDGHACQVCGRHESQLLEGQHLEVHLDPALRGDHLASTVADCVTVCSRCHPRLPGKRGRA
jgi:5-methylcytosine-specific restriction endonuclease McrA